jgi:HK97 family phage portal protein
VILAFDTKQHDRDEIADLVTADEIVEAERLHEKTSSIPPDPHTDESLGNWNMEVKAQLDLLSLKGLIYNDQWVFITVNYVARKLSAQLMSVHKRSIKQGKLVETPVPFHALNDLIAHPNAYEGYTNFMYRVATELTLMGNAIIWKMRFHDQLILLPTEFTTIDFDPHGNITGYSVSNGTLNNDPLLNQAIKINPDDIIHIRLPNPNSVVWGLSPWIPGRRSVLFDRYSQEYLLNFYLKQANPGPVIEMGKDANEKQAVRLLRSIEQRYTGRANQRRTMILPKDVKAKKLSDSISDQKLVEHLQDNRETIRALLAVPPHAYGTQKTGSIGSDETEKQMRNFWETTIIPYQDLIAEGFDMGFARELTRRYVWMFQNDDVPALQENNRERAETANLMLQTHTLNQVRSVMYSAEPLPGGDETPKNNQPQQPGFQQFSAPPEVEEVKEITGPRQTIESRKLRTFMDYHMDHFTKSESTDELRKQEMEYLSQILGIFADAAPKAVKAFLKVFKPKSVADVVVKHHYQSKDNRDDLAKELDKIWEQFKPDYQGKLEPVILKAGEAGYDLSLETPFDLGNEEEIAAIRDENKEVREEVLKARGLEGFSGITKTTTNQILDVVASGQQDSKSLDQIARDISSYFKEIVPSRAQTIARTEALTASSLAQEAAAEDVKNVLPGTKEYWVTAGDNRVRGNPGGLYPKAADNHWALDGTTRGKNGKFANGLRFPRDPAGKAAQTINCRCTTLLVPPDEDLDVESINKPDLLPGQIE